MPTDLQIILSSVTASRSNRIAAAQFILENHTLYNELLETCFDVTNKLHPRACWVLEFVSYDELLWLQPHLDFFCSNLKNLKDEKAIRAIAKVIQLLIKAHDRNLIVLAEVQLQDCIECSFDWLISDTKVATKAYSIRTLYLLGKQYKWIHPELQILLNKDYSLHSPAYKAVAREVLKKIK